ncbi:MAG: general secretion pathway protein GspB [Gammaproteobacteria bacterium]
MSYILKALRKSEQERRNKESETLRQRIAEIPPQSPKRSYGLVPLLMLINVALLGYFIWDHYRHAPAVVAPNTVPAQAEQQPVKASQLEPVEIVREPDVAVNERAPTQRPVPKPGPQIKPMPVVVKKTPQPVPEPLKKAEPEIEPSPKAEDQSISPLETNPKRIEQAGISVDKPDAAPAVDAIPYVNELPYEFRTRLPSITINVFVYSEQAADSFVMIDMEKYRVGQLIQGQLELTAIRPDSLVVRYEDRVFKIRRP